MVAWQPESGLSPDECNDLRLARYSRLVHHLRRIGESAPEWEENMVFSAARPESPLPPSVVEPILMPIEATEVSRRIEMPRLEVA